MNRFDAVLYRLFFQQEPPSSNNLFQVKSDEEIAREVVMDLARGDTCLQLGFYLTEEKVEARRQKVIAYHPTV